MVLNIKRTSRLSTTQIHTAIIKDFNNAETKYHLAVTLSQLNRSIKARKYIKEAIESENSFSDKSNAIQLMEELSVK